MVTTAGGTFPERTHVQRISALERANEIRCRRARLKRDVRAGRAQVAPLLLEPPEYLHTMKAFELILAMPKLGRVKVNRLFTGCMISPSKTVGGMSERQRCELVCKLEGRS